MQILYSLIYEQVKFCESMISRLLIAMFLIFSQIIFHKIIIFFEKCFLLFFLKKQCVNKITFYCFIKFEKKKTIIINAKKKKKNGESVIKQNAKILNKVLQK